MQNQSAVRLTSSQRHGAVPHHGGAGSAVYEDASRSVRKSPARVSIVSPPSVTATKPLARLGRAILAWLDKEDDRVALI